MRSKWEIVVKSETQAEAAIRCKAQDSSITLTFHNISSMFFS